MSQSCRIVSKEARRMKTSLDFEVWESEELIVRAAKRESATPLSG